MPTITLRLHASQTVLAERSGTDTTYLAWRHAYAQGDYFDIQVEQAPCFIVAQLDGSLAPALLYLKSPTWRFEIPFNAQREWPYPDGAFVGRNHYATVRYARPDEIKAQRNLAVNSHDQHGEATAFPHAFANAETRQEAVFFAKNAIDGMVANEAHGNYPFQSWGVDQNDQAQLTVDFGRPVTISAVTLVLRADYPHDSYWTDVTLVGSDSTHHRLALEKTAAPQTFALPAHTVTWLRLEQLHKAPDSSTFPALTEILVTGHEG